MPSPSPGPCTILAIDPGETTGIAVLSLNPRWLRGQGSPTPAGILAATVSRYGVQIGRYPKVFDDGRGKASVTTNAKLESSLMPIYANQPLDDEEDPATRFFARISGEGPAGGGDLTTIQANELSQVRHIAGLLEIHAKAALVIEGFALRKFTQDPSLLSPDRLRFAITANELLHGTIGRTPFLQQPSYAMTTATDDRLQRARLYLPGMPHATDAMRHAMTFARDCRKDESIRRAAFPRHFKAPKES